MRRIDRLARCARVINAFNYTFFHPVFKRLDALNTNNSFAPGIPAAGSGYVPVYIIQGLALKMIEPETVVVMYTRACIIYVCACPIPNIISSLVGPAPLNSTLVIHLVYIRLNVTD